MGFLKSPPGCNRTIMTDPLSALERIAAINASAAFNRLARFEVVAAGGGAAELRMEWRDDLTQ